MRFSVIPGRRHLQEQQVEAGDHKLSYYFEPADSDTLVVSFSSFPGKYRKARYNYIHTLSSVPANRLFILDNFGYHNRGSYYLGLGGRFFIEQAVSGLIEDLCRSLNIRRRIFIGTSKGGTAALYFGLKYGAECIIAGAPQYYIGSYLSYPKNRVFLEAIMGDASPESIRRLDALLPGLIASGGPKIKIFLHYSTQEHTYREHIVHLLEALKRHPERFTLSCDVRDYPDHGTVAEYYPPFLLDVLSKELPACAAEKDGCCVPSIR